ncbi:MAG: hypothetical protein ABFS09_08670 [Thermodesulfobacteriota bacterium]
MDPLHLNEEEKTMIGELPERWLRMDLMSQVAVLEVGRLLRRHSQLEGTTGKVNKDLVCALIVGSCYGSLATDKEYAATLEDGIEFASPALFGYTLANIAPAEAASHYGITGPVFALLDPAPLEAARTEAQRWHSYLGPGALIIYGELDVIPTPHKPAITATFHLLKTP